MTQVDANVGRLLAKLDELGLAGRTAVVFTSDHGDMQGSHGLTNKCLPYEESAGIPLIARIPGGVRGTSDALVSGVDFFPTCLTLSGVAVPGGWPGADFSPTLRGGRIASRPVFSEMKDWKMVCEGDWKLVVATSEYRPTMLFDLSTDPCEMANLVDAPGQADRIAAMRGLIVGWQSGI